MTVKFEHALGDIVIIDPVGTRDGPKGKVTGQVIWESGSISYFVSCGGGFDGEIKRHVVNPSEIRAEKVKP